MTDEVWSFDGDRNESKYNIQTGEKVKINLRAMTKAAIERIVARGHVENEEEQILISTAALLYDFLLSKGENCQLTVRLREYQRDVGFFFPPLVEAILEWVKEGRQSIIEKIKVLDGVHARTRRSLIVDNPDGAGWELVEWNKDVKQNWNSD